MLRRSAKRADLRAVPLEDVTLRVWCEKCLLPSALSAPFGVTLDGRPDRVCVLAFCLDCGHTWCPQ
jgi:RNase P subunit RPR2